MVKNRKSPCISVHIVAMPVKHIEIHQIDKAQPCKTAFSPIPVYGQSLPHFPL